MRERSFCFLTERWLITSWGSLGADEIIYHIKAPLTGTNTEIIWKLILQFLLPGFLILAVLTAVYILSHSNRLKKGLMIGSVAAFFLMLGFIVYDLQVQTGLPETIVYEVLGLGKNSDDFFEREYVDAGKLKLKFPEKKRNLIYIFLESTEITFADKENGGAFEQNCIPNLTKLAEENEDFSGADSNLNGGYVLSGTDWTTGAMFGQSSGMPLKLPIRSDFESGSALFPGLTTLGDILQKEGYQRRLLLGSDIQFGGRAGYYYGHGNYEVHDYPYAIANGLLPEDYYVWWGFEDEKLFDFAKAELPTMQEPFCYTMLTVDTHFDDGYVCRLCGDEFGENQYANVFACMDKQVTDFIQWIQKQNFYENTTVVICGDHLTMDSDFCIDVPKEYSRKTYVTFLNSAATPADPDKKRVYSTLDLFPTTLASMGVKIPGNRMGVGVNLYSKEETILERYGVEECKKIFAKPSNFMATLAGEETTDFIDGRWFGTDWTVIGDEKLGLHMMGLGGIDPSYVERIYAEITDVRTGEMTVCEMHYEPNNPNPSNAYGETEYPHEDVECLTAVCYIKLYDEEPKQVWTIEACKFE